ncbi:MAG: hypothetical protein WC900_06630 [Oscillospiraceae bacterium]|jgi:hypothetical protein
MRNAYLFCFVFIFAACAFCATNTIEIQAKGQGVSRDEAIKNALTEAVAQVNGAEINTTAAKYDLIKANVRGNDNNQTVIILDSVPRDTDEKFKVSGFIKTYEVLEETKVYDDTYEVVLKAFVYDYQTPEQNNKYKLEVLPIQTSEEIFNFDGEAISANKLSERLRHKINTVLANTNRFSILSEDLSTSFNKSERDTDSSSLSLEEKHKTNQALTPDYILTGFLSDVRFKSKDKYLRAIDKTVKEHELDLIFDYKIIVAPTKQLKVSDSIRYHLETNEIKGLMKKNNIDELNISELTDSLLTMLSNQTVSEAIDRIYPIRIAVIDENGRVIINQGGDRIKEGIILDVIKEGEEIIDFATKESLGSIETVVAKIKITQVKPNFAYAEIIGDGKVSEGLICRMTKPKEPKIHGLKSEIKIDSNKGIKLPIEQ